MIRTNKNNVFGLEVQVSGFMVKTISLLSIYFLTDENKYICDIKVKEVKDLIGEKLSELESGLSFGNNEEITEIYELKYINEII